MKKPDLSMGRLFLFLVDVVCLAVSTYYGDVIRHGREGLHSEDASLMFLCMLFAYLLVTLFSDYSKNFQKRTYFAEVLHACLFDANVVVLGVFFSFLTKTTQSLSRLAFIYFIIGYVLLTSGLHCLIKLFHRRYITDKNHKTRTILLAQGPKAAEIILSKIDSTDDFQYSFDAICLLDDALSYRIDSKVCDIPITCTTGTLIDYCKTHPVDTVFFSGSSSKRTALVPMLTHLGDMGINVQLNLDMAFCDIAPVHKLDRIGPYDTLSYSYIFQTPNQKILSRMLDVFGALVGCIITLPFIVIFAPLIKIQAPGPVFFKQKRVGKNGRVFTMYKFRTMYVDAEERKKELMEQNEMDGLMFKMKNDPRIFPIGKFLRRTSIDELPQFFNVLKGDMSLVGTRPPTVDEYNQYEYLHKRRLSLKPGITGLWQTSGRSEVNNFSEVVKMDCDYIDNWSLAGDIKLIIKTVGVVLAGRGAE